MIAHSQISSLPASKIQTHYTCRVNIFNCLERILTSFMYKVLLDFTAIIHAILVELINLGGGVYVLAKLMTTRSVGNWVHECCGSARWVNSTWSYLTRFSPEMRVKFHALTGYLLAFEKKKNTQYRCVINVREFRIFRMIRVHDSRFHSVKPLQPQIINDP